MKNIFFVFALFLTFNIAQAQIYLGIDGSYGSSTVTYPNGTYSISTGFGGGGGENRSSMDRTPAFRVGVFGEWRFSKSALQTGFKYARYGFENEGKKINFAYLDMDISVSYYFWEILNFNFGVTPSLLIDEPNELELESFDIRPFLRLGVVVFEKYKIYGMATTGVLELNEEFELKGNYIGIGVSVALLTLAD